MKYFGEVRRHIGRGALCCTICVLIVPIALGQRTHNADDGIDVLSVVISPSVPAPDDLPVLQPLIDVLDGCPLGLELMPLGPLILQLSELPVPLPLPGPAQRGLLRHDHIIARRLIQSAPSRTRGLG